MKTLPLRVQLIIGLIILGTLVTFISSGIQVYVDYGDELREIDNEFAVVEHISIPILSSAIQAEDAQYITFVMGGIISLPAIHKAQLLRHNHPPTDVGKLGNNNGFIEKRFDILAEDGTQAALGQLIVFASLQTVYHKLYRRAGLILLANGLRTLLVAMFVAYFLDRLITRHVRQVARYLQRTPPGKPSPDLKLKRNPIHYRDELDELVDSVNYLRANLHVYEQSLQGERNRYFALVENNPEAIWRCELPQPVVLPLADPERTVLLLEQAHIAEMNEVAKALIAPTEPTQTATWTILPFLQQSLWQALVQNQFRVKDVVTYYCDTNNQPHYFSNSVSCINLNNQISTIWGISVDITQRILAQQALERREQQLQISQSRLAEAQALAHMGHWEYYTANDQLIVSEEFTRIYGFPADQPPTSWRQLVERIHPEDRSYVVAALSKADSEAIGAEHRIIWPNGEARHVQAVARKTIVEQQVVSTFGIILDISDRRRAEEARRHSQQELIESEARMAEAQAIAHMGHWIMDYRTKTFSCSDEFYRLYGHPPRAFAPSIRPFMEQVHPDDRAHLEQVLTRAKEITITENYRILRPDGQLRYIRGTATPFYSGGRQIERVFGISLDITEQKLAEMALQASQELFSKAFAASPDGIAFIAADDFSIVEINQTLALLTGYSETQLVGQPVAMLTGQQDDHALHTLLAQINEKDNLEIAIEHAQGQRLTCLISWRPVEVQGVTRLLAFIRDVTQLRLLEQTTEKQNRQLLHADKLASLGTMVAGVAHEINNPNHLIQMNADLLNEFNHYISELLTEFIEEDTTALEFNGLPLTEILETMPELLNDITASSKRIDRIVKDLKDFSRPRDNAQFLPVNLNHIIEKSQNLLLPSLERENVSVQYDLSPLPLIEGDSQQLEQVVVNLTMNAIDASKGKTSQLFIRTHFDPHLKVVVCEVQDYGCGISTEHLSHIFDPFFTTKQEQGGTGLGLAISYRLIREHSGELEAFSQPGQGCTMRFSLPVTSHGA